MKLALRILGIVFLLAQFVRPPRTNPPVDPAVDLTAVVAVPADVAELLRASCYDCHSNETAWPWYASVAPSSWLVVRDTNEGRRHLNFSEWGSFPARKVDHKLGELIEMVEERKMPLPVYLPLHPDAKLSDEGRARLVQWAEEERGKSGESR